MHRARAAPRLGLRKPPHLTLTAGEVSSSTTRPGRSSAVTRGSKSNHGPSRERVRAACPRAVIKRLGVSLAVYALSLARAHAAPLQSASQPGFRSLTAWPRRGRRKRRVPRQPRLLGVVAVDCALVWSFCPSSGLQRRPGRQADVLLGRTGFRRASARVSRSSFPGPHS